MKYFTVLSLFFVAVSCRHHDRKVTIIEKAQAPNGQSASELLRSAAGQTNYGGSEAAQLLNAAAGGQQPQFTQEQIAQLKQILAQQQAERQNQPPHLGLGGPSAAGIMEAAAGNQNLGYNPGSRFQDELSNKQQQQQQQQLLRRSGKEKASNTTRCPFPLFTRFSRSAKCKSSLGSHRLQLGQTRRMWPLKGRTGDGKQDGLTLKDGIICKAGKVHHGAGQIAG